MIKMQGRCVLVPSHERSIGVEQDNKSETKNFTVPRFYEDMDLLAASPFIKTMDNSGYMNKFSLLPELDQENILLSWLVPDVCMQSAGRLYFQLQFELPDPTPEEIIVWQSEMSFFTVENTIPADGELGKKNQGIIQKLTAQADELAAELEIRGNPLGGEEAALLAKYSAKDYDFGWIRQNYKEHFVTGDWTLQNGVYTIVIPSTRHLLGSLPGVKSIMRQKGTDLQKVFSDAIISTAGDVTITADAPFVGCICLCR